MIKIEPLLQNTHINLQRSRRAFEQQHNLYQRTRTQPQIERRYTTTLPETSSVKSSTPLSSRGMQIPHEIKQYCHREGIDVKPSVFDCVGQYFWMAIDNTIFLWRYKNIHIWGKNPSEAEMLLIVTFPQLIKTAQMGDIIGYQFNSLNNIKLFAIALTNKIVFFNYCVEKQTFENMKIQVITNNQIVTNIVFVDGRIFYCGSHGTLKTIFNKPRFLLKQTRFKMKSSSWFKDTINNSILFWKVNYITSQLTIIGDKAYFILQKHYPTSKMAMNILFRGRKQIERTIKVFNINTNSLIRQIQERLLLERVRLHCGRSKQLMQGIRIIGLFENNGKLGLSLSCGAFAFLNLQGLLVEEVQFIPLVQTRGIIGQQVNFELDVMETISSLGFNNLSIFNKCGVAFSSKNTIDIFPNINISFDLFKIKQLKPTNNQYCGTMFAQQQQWLCLGASGITQLKRLRLQDIVLVYLQIMSEQRVFKKNYLADQPFLHLYYLFGGIDVCVALMQIICNSDMEVQISNQVYQKTKLQIFKFESFLNKRQYHESQQLSQNISIAVNENIIKIAAEVLSYIESRDLNSQIDILWKSILKYFNEIYQLIKHLTPSQCISQFKLIQFVKNKLECFKRLLHIKSLELSPHQINISQNQSLSFIGTEKNNIPPREMSLRQKYDTNTPILITRTKQLIDKIYCLIEVCTILKFESKEDLYDEPTIHNILTDNTARDILRFRILKDVDPTNNVLFKLTKVFPQLLNESDQIFNQHILNTKNNQVHANFSVDSLVPALKTQRIPIFKYYFYNRKQIYQYLALLLQRMKYLQIQKQKLKQKQNKYYPFAEYDTIQKQEQLKQLQQNWLQIVDHYEQSLRDYIRQVGKSQIINRLQLLLHYVRSLQIEPITSFTQQILQEQALPQMIKILKQRNDKVELKPKTLYQF